MEEPNIAWEPFCINHVSLTLRLTVDTLFWKELVKSCHHLTQSLAVGKCSAARGSGFGLWALLSQALLCALGRLQWNWRLTDLLENSAWTIFISFFFFLLWNLWSFYLGKIVNREETCRKICKCLSSLQKYSEIQLIIAMQIQISNKKTPQTSPLGYKRKICLLDNSPGSAWKTAREK